MMYRKINGILIILFFTVIVLLGTDTIAYADESNDKIIILYDTYNVYGEKENILNDTNQIAIKSGKQVDIEDIKNYKAGDINNYNKAIIILNNNKSLEKPISIDLKKYKGNIIWAGDFKASNKSNNKIEPNNRYSKKQLLNEINGSNKKENRTYLLIDNVNPFIDLNSLVDKIDYLNSNGIQFILDTIPIFENKDFNSMKRFSEVLRYAQSKGGYIVLRYPYLKDDNVPSKDIIDAMTVGDKNYINYWIYPMAIDIPEFLLYRNDMKEFLMKSDTVFISDSSVPLINFSYFKNSRFKNVITKINYKDIKNLSNENLYGDTAISIDNDVDINKFKEIINSLINKQKYFQNPSSIETYIDINGDKITSNTTGIYLNDNTVTQNRFISNKEFEDKTYEKNLNNKTNKEKDISKITNILTIFAGITCAIFVIISILSRRIDRKKYFK